MLVNGILYSTEALISLNKSHIDTLEACDKDFMAKLFYVPHTTPYETYYTETAAIPLRFLLTGRRLMFYWSVLQKPESELVKQVYLATREFPSKGGWQSNIMDDLLRLKIDKSEKEIQGILKHSFKKLIKERIQEDAINFLKEKQNQHSKTKNLIANGEMKEYLKSSYFSTSDKQDLFKLKCGMSPNKLSYKNNFSDLTCRICRLTGSEESLGHLLRCPTLTQRKDLPEIENIRVEDLFGDLDQQAKALKIFRTIFSILDDSNKDNRGPS